jgi:hypothetical protein
MENERRSEIMGMLELASGDATDHREDRFQVFRFEGLSRLGVQGRVQGSQKVGGDVVPPLGHLFFIQQNFCLQKLSLQK